MNLSKVQVSAGYEVIVLEESGNRKMLLEEL